MSADAAQQFNALWMGRALTDIGALNPLHESTLEQDSSELEQSNVENAALQLQNRYTIDISGIPFLQLIKIQLMSDFLPTTMELVTCSF